MNSTKVSVSGSNSTRSIFITLSESQKEQAERLEYEIKNSHTSTEEEEEEEQQQAENKEKANNDVIKNDINVLDELLEAKKLAVSLKNRCVDKDIIIRKLHENIANLTIRFNKKNTQLKEERSFRRDNEDNFFRLLNKYNKCDEALKKVTL